MLSAVMAKMRIKWIQRKQSLPVSLLSLIPPLLSLCLPHHHRSSDQSVRERPKGLHRGRAGFLRAYYVLGPKSFYGLDIFIENWFFAVCLNWALFQSSSLAFLGHFQRQSSYLKFQLITHNVVISYETPYVQTVRVNTGRTRALLFAR